MNFPNQEDFDDFPTGIQDPSTYGSGVTNPTGNLYPPLNAQPVTYYYYISSKLNGMVLTVKGASLAPFTKIVLSPKKEPLDADSQLWYNDYSTGTIKSKLHNQCIQFLDDALFSNNVEVGNTNQLWEGVGTIIRNRFNPNLVFEVQGGQAHDGAVVTATNYTGSPQQQFEPIFPPPPSQTTPTAPPQPSSAGGYPLPNMAGGGPNVPLPEFNPPKTHEKKLFHIMSKLNGFVMDICGAKENEGALVISYPKSPNNAKNQLWYFDEDGFIRSALNDFVPCATGKATQLKMVKFTGGASQRFRLDGSKIVNGVGECVDIRGASKKECAQIITYPYNGDLNQQWVIQYV